MAKNEWQKTNHCAPPPLLYDFIFEWWGGGGIEKFLYVAGPKVENIFQRDQKSKRLRTTGLKYDK